MKVVVLSGKGGAGKTFVSVNLAVVAAPVTYVDCDVEEPNGHLYWHPSWESSVEVQRGVPRFAVDKCIGCRKCIEFCRFHALAFIKKHPLVFADVCHSCGGCALVCPTGAITMEPHGVGIVREGISDKVKVVGGMMNIGEVSGVPIIKQALQMAEGWTHPIIIDAPPGSGCLVMETVAAADYCVLVVEPTAFGLHDVAMVYELVTLMGKKTGVVINKYEEPYLPLEDYCAKRGVAVLARLPFTTDIAATSAQGKILTQEDAGLQHSFSQLWQEIGKQVSL